MGVLLSKKLTLDDNTAVRKKPDFQEFDAVLKRTTSGLLSSFSLSDDGKVSSLTLESFKVLTDYYKISNQQAIELFHKCKDNILNDDDFFDVMKDFFDSSVVVLELCSAIENRLIQFQKAKRKLSSAMEDFGQEYEKGDKSYTRTLKALQDLNEILNPPDQDFSFLIESLYKKHLMLLENLVLRKKKLNKKLKGMKSWITFSNVLFGMTSASIFVCSFVVVAGAAPPQAPPIVGLVGALTGALKDVFPPIKGWKKYTDELITIASMKLDTGIVVLQLQCIKNLVESLVGDAMSDPMKGDEEMTETIISIEDRIEDFSEEIGRLEDHITNCHQAISAGRNNLLQTMINFRSSHNNYQIY